MKVIVCFAEVNEVPEQAQQNQPTDISMITWILIWNDMNLSECQNTHINLVTFATCDATYYIEASITKTGS